MTPEYRFGAWSQPVPGGWPERWTPESAHDALERGNHEKKWGARLPANDKYGATEWRLFDTLEEAKEHMSAMWGVSKTLGKVLVEG